MSDLERRIWWLLRAYPQPWREERGEDLVATVLSMSRPHRRWPTVRTVVDLVAGGWSERAHQHRRSSGSWSAAGRRVALVAAVMLQVVVAGVWLRQWVIDGFLPMLPVLGAASAYTLVGALYGFIAAAVAWLVGLAGPARVVARVAFASWLVTVCIFQVALSGHTPSIAVLLAWTYLAALATWGLGQPPPANPAAVGMWTAVAGVVAAAAVALPWTPDSSDWLRQAQWGSGHLWWVEPAWVVGAIVAIVVARKDPRWVIAASLLLPLVVFLRPPALTAVSAGLAGLAAAVLLAAFLGPRAASSR